MLHAWISNGHERDPDPDAWTFDQRRAILARLEQWRARERELEELRRRREPR